jgi:mRNA interferase MazF
MAPGEIYFAQFPFGGSARMKLRPVLLLTGPVGSVPELLTAYITSVMPAPLLPSDIMLDPSQPEHASSGLKMRSVIRLHKLATLHQRLIVRYLGKLSVATETEVAARLRQLLNL